MAIIDCQLLFMLISLLYLVFCQKECQPIEADEIYSNLSSCSYIHFRTMTEFRINKGIVICYKTRFQIIGNAFNKTKIYCSNTSGVTFNNVGDIVFKDVEFYGCGEWHFYPNKTVTTGAAIWILNCMNINISNTSFYGSRGTALVLINTSGFVQITSCIFHSGGINEWEEMSVNGGGGLYIQQTHDSVASVNISVLDCVFSDNQASGTCHPATCDTECTFGYGGGLAISIQNPLAGVFVSISRCHFQNNSAIAGGGVEITICTCYQSVIEFENVTFCDNEASEEGGGALDIILNDESESGNQVRFSNVKFLRNDALYGGGIAVAIYTNIDSSSILFVNCLWQENIAHYGSAINIFPEKTFNDRVVVNVSISDSNFINNSNCNEPDNKTGLFQLGIAVIKITGYKMSFLGTIQFVKNYESCIYAIGSEIHFQGANISFISNVAEYGSGISLVGLSKITTSHTCHVRFSDNYAQREHPAIYYSAADSRQILNTKHYSPQIISNSGTVSFHDCGNFIPKDRRYFDDSHVEKLTVPNEIHFLPCTSHSNHTPTLAAARRMCKYSENDNSDLLYFIPGIEKDLSLEKTRALFLVTLNYRSSHSITLPEIYGHITDKLVLQGEPGETAEVTLHDTDFNGLHKTFRAKLTACPVLYELSNDKCTCVSASDIHFHSSFRCNVTGYMSYSSISSGYWIGIEMSSDYNESITLMGRCPIGFCNTNQSWIELPYTNTTTNSAAIDKVLCNRRQGRLCGTCANGTVVYVHSRTYKCGGMDLCHWGWVFFLSAEILPLTAFFSGVVFFRVKLTAGGVSGFIFFAQMCVYMNNKLEASNYTIPYQYTAFHHFVYQLFNLEFAELDSLSFCFLNQLRNLDVLLVKYAVSLYCFALIVLTVALAKFSRRFKLAKWMISSKRSIVQTLSTFIIMVYSKCTFTTFSILWYQQLYDGTKPTKKVVSLQGELDYFSPQHLPYAVPAILVLVLFTVPLPLILLLYPLSNKVIAKLGLGETRVVGTISKMLPLSKLLPLLDCFQGSFKDRYRFFSGLYFTYRILVLSTLTTLAVSRSYLIVTILVTAMLVVHTLAWPYKKKIHNAIDALLFGNLAIISGLKAFIIILEGNASMREIEVTHAVEIVLINLPIAVIAAYFVACACIAAKKLGKKSTISQVALNDFFLSDDIRQENLDRYQLMKKSHMNLIK